MNPAVEGIRIGTRASPLARWQAQWVADQLAKLGRRVVLVPITTHGDVDRQSAIGEIGTTGVFTKELQRALLDDRIDLAVHSLKDLPTEAPPGLTIAAVPPRESPHDVLVSRDGRLLDDLPNGARIGTGSARRQAQLLHHRPDLKMIAIRGNVETRLARLDAGECDALVLAEAGLKRLDLVERITERLTPPRFFPAVGQGALAVEAREGSPAAAVASQLENSAARAAVSAERSLLHALQGGCLAPVAAFCETVTADELELTAIVLSPDGRTRLGESARGRCSEAVAIGETLAAILLKQGAGALIRSARQE
jgi:hydroxymethylbilane synthase